eukprot:COSAG06_NODE_11691_length_1476_cov_6.345679_2_plen_232_part_00
MPHLLLHGVGPARKPSQLAQCDRTSDTQSRCDSEPAIQTTDARRAVERDGGLRAPSSTAHGRHGVLLWAVTDGLARAVRGQWSVRPLTAAAAGSAGVDPGATTCAWFWPDRDERARASTPRNTPRDGRRSEQDEQPLVRGRGRERAEVQAVVKTDVAKDVAKDAEEVKQGQGARRRSRSLACPSRQRLVHPALNHRGSPGCSHLIISRCAAACGARGHPQEKVSDFNLFDV